MRERAYGWGGNDANCHAMVWHQRKKAELSKTTKSIFIEFSRFLSALELRMNETFKGNPPNNNGKEHSSKGRFLFDDERREKEP